MCYLRHPTSSELSPQLSIKSQRCLDETQFPFLHLNSDAVHFGFSKQEEKLLVLSSDSNDPLCIQILEG